MERWKDIEGYEGKYQVSNYGNVKSLNYNNTGKEKLLKLKINRYGYYEVKLSKNNKTKNYLVSTLVAKAFIENKNPDKIPIHVGDTKDNSVENIKYAYRSEMLFLTYKKGKRKGTPSLYRFSFDGEKYNRISELARKYNIPPKQVMKRLSRGWSLSEAVEIPLKRKNKILNVALYRYNGELLSVSQIAKKYNIDKKNIYKRLSRNWSIDEVIEIPLSKKKVRE